ncbi:hypothetical protein [Lactobacillus sp.]|uniref:hypothetical protein n=1 Tax=Lactobacillus sp. TaxID=1591 RepID=UPI0019966D1D|nr:hypothetical protein [Lactobacillus sp.]MBD5429691.1 hypothetical protein [Lactobacillus sp.]
MKAVFAKETKESEIKIGYGTILLCKVYDNDENFDLYRVSNHLLVAFMTFQI